MRISKKRLEELLREDRQLCQKRLRIWVEAAEAELEGKGTPRERFTILSSGPRARQAASACSWRRPRHNWMPTPSC